MALLSFYRTPALSLAKKSGLLSFVQKNVSADIHDIESEFCFYIETNGIINDDESSVLHWLLAETFEPENFSSDSFLLKAAQPGTSSLLYEV